MSTVGSDNADQAEQLTGANTASDAPRGEAQWVLVVLRHGAIEEHTLSPRRLLRIGRDEGVEIRINHRSISRVHATIGIVDGNVQITDLQSRNGTMVAGRLLGREPHVAAEGTTITFGEVACHLMTARRSEFRSELRVEPDEFDRRLVHEGERALRHDHSVGAMVVMLGGSTPVELQRALRTVVVQLRDLDIYSVRSAQRVDVMLFETDRRSARDEATRIAAALAAAETPSRIGIACFPGDAPTPSLLVEAAAMAAASDGPGVHLADDAVRVLRFGDLEVIVADRAMHRVFGLLERVAPSDLSVLINGETGTGKEVIANALHAISPRKRRPLVAINCAALPENLLESELFGHERGAFSGASATKPGLFEQADGGTLFLDEIGEMHPSLQAKLLRVLETKRVRRVGGIEERSLDVRLVSATHRDLDRQVENGAFRQDLLFRLRGMQIVLPPLRERPHEIAILAQRFLTEACQASRRVPLMISSTAAAALSAYAWPGNIRELRHAMSSAAVLAEGDTLTLEDLPEAIRSPRATPASRHEADDNALSLDEAVRAYERARIERALETSGGNQSQAARLLGIPRKTLVSKLKALGIRRDE